MSEPSNTSNTAVAASDEEGCQFPLGPSQLCGRPVVRSGKPGRPSAYCDDPGHTRAKAFAARRVYEPAGSGQASAGPAGESVADRPVSYGRMSFEALLAQFQQVAQGHCEQMAALVDQASQLARTVADPDATAYEVEEAHRAAEKRVAEADAAQAHAEREARDARRAREHAIEERAQADEAAQEALIEAERIRAEADTEVTEARGLAESAVAAEATAREENENIRLDAEKRVDAAERDATERIQTALDEQARTLAEERQRAEEQAEHLRRETAATVAAAHGEAAAARTAQTRAEAGQQTAEHTSAEAQATVEQLRTELAELRQQHRTELDTLRAESRAERDQLRTEHRDQLADVRAVARTAEQRADEQRDRADRAEAIIAK
jgi:colicin import membrane protein